MGGGRGRARLRRRRRGNGGPGRRRSRRRAARSGTTRLARHVDGSCRETWAAEAVGRVKALKVDVEKRKRNGRGDGGRWQNIGEDPEAERARILAAAGAILYRGRDGESLRVDLHAVEEPDDLLSNAARSVNFVLLISHMFCLYI